MYGGRGRSKGRCRVGEGKGRDRGRVDGMREGHDIRVWGRCKGRVEIWVGGNGKGKGRGMW